MNKERLLLISLALLFCISIVLSLFQHKSSQKPDSLSALANTDGIGVLTLYEPITISPPSPFSPVTGVDGLIEQIKDFEKDKRIKALIVRINSPGGTVGASQELYQAIITFKQKTKKPVVVSIADVGASGAYWTAVAGDTIFANPGSLVGSIGVYVGNFDFSEVPKRYGIGFNLFKSVEHKDILSSWRKTTPEEKDIIQGMLSDIHSQFVAVVAKERKLPLEKAAELADGRIYSGHQALDLHLIDQLGSFQDAVNYTAKLVKIKEEPLLIYPEQAPLHFMKQILKGQSQTGFSLNTLIPNVQ